jgi:non-ribosomal peptide synthetase component F
MTFLAAFEILLHHNTGQRDIVIGANTSNREWRETEALIGFFVNQLAMRVRIEGDPTFRELLQEVREVTLDAYAHQQVPFDRLVEALKLERNLSRAPLFQVKLDLLDTPAADLSGMDLNITPLMAHTGRSRLDLIISLTNTSSEVTGWLLYDTDLFDLATVMKLFKQFEFVLERVIAEPDTTLSSFTQALTEAEQQQARAREAGFRKANSDKLKKLRRRTRS